jgi:hypothetical protein
VNEVSFFVRLSFSSFELFLFFLFLRARCRNAFLESEHALRAREHHRLGGRAAARGSRLSPFF